MKRVNIKTGIGGKLKEVCESLSEKERKGVLVSILVVSILVVSTILCGITVTRAFGRFFSHGTGKELPFGKDIPVDSLHRTEKDSMMYHPKSTNNER